MAISVSHVSNMPDCVSSLLGRVVEDLSFSAPRLRGQSVVIDGPFVKDRLKDFDPIRKDNVAKYIL